jgi:hypothetical protein
LESGAVDPSYSSHKFYKKAGYRYEIGLAIFFDHIVWLNGPFPCGSYNDHKIYTEGLGMMLKNVNEKAVADAGYSHYTISKKYNGSHEWKKAKSRIRARYESVNSRFKNFKICESIFRHPLHLHSDVIRCIVLLTQLNLSHNPLMVAFV